MKECIICRKNVASFNDEHVIPDSLGGYYHIYSVCTKCNSNLGTKVDSSLVNHKFADFQRFLLGLKGKNGKIPNPFKGTHVFRENPKQKVQVRIDSDQKTVPYIIPTVTYGYKDGIAESVEVIIDATDEKNLDAILKKTAKHIGVPFERISFCKKRVRTASPEIHGILCIDLNDFKLGLLKIAYEFAVDSIADYYNDPTAIEICKVLLNGSHDRSKEFVKIGDGFHHEIMKPFEHLLDLESKKHYLVLASSKTLGLVCFIRLHQLFSIGVVLSEKGYIEDGIIVGINDLNARNFRKLNASELMNETHSVPKLRFKYYFQNQQQVDDFFLLERSPDFEIFKIDGAVPFFNRNGTLSGKTVDEKLAQLENLAQFEKLGGGGATATIAMDEELFIKVLPSNKLFMVTAIREERSQTRKL